MWTYLTRLILRRRYWNLLVIGLLTIFMVYHARHVSLSYEMTQMLPSSDSTNIEYQIFKEMFGQDGSVLFIGLQDSNLYQLEEFNDWYDLTEEIQNIPGVEGIVSLSKLYQLTKNDSVKKFDFLPVFKEKPKTQKELDSLVNVVFSLNFYDGLLFNSESSVTLIAVTLDKEILNTKARVGLIYDIKATGDRFAEKHDIKLHYSGLPYIRTITAKKVERELQLFVILALVIASVILLIFFRNLRIVLATMLIVIVNVVWVLGIISLLGYKITMLTGILPPLIIVIVVENSIFLLNKYHAEIKKHGNKIRALTRVVMFIGNANLLTNTTTAAGFAAFIVTGNSALIEFGVVASLGILIAYFLTLFLIPIFFSFLPLPVGKHTSHLEKGIVKSIIERVVYTVQNHRTIIYSITIAIVLVAFYGISQLKTTGNIVDDIPHKDPLYVDLMFFEKHFNGVMPLEISINTNKKKGVLNLATIRRIDKLQEVLGEYPELSKPLSIAEVVKFAKQAFYNGNPERYSLPNSQEKNFIMQYVPQMQGDKRTILNSFVDTSLQVTRISVQLANIGTNDIERIRTDLKPQIDSIFPPDRYDVTLTGTSVIFLEGTNYLIKNLLTSLILALIVISILMAMLFTSARMVMISMAPNLLPSNPDSSHDGFPVYLHQTINHSNLQHSPWDFG